MKRKLKPHMVTKNKAENQRTDCDALLSKIQWLDGTQLSTMELGDKQKLLSCALLIEQYQQRMPIKEHDVWYGVLCRMTRKYETYQR